MKRRFLKDEPFPIHVVFHSGRSRFPGVSKSEVWEWILSELKSLKIQEKCKPVAAVLMSNHLHLLIYPQAPHSIEPLQKFCLQLQEYLEAKSKYNANTSQSEWSFLEIRNIKTFQNCYKYIFQNPIESGVCQRILDYPYSSIYEILMKNGPSIFSDEMNLIFNPVKTIEWIEENHAARRPGCLGPRELSAPNHYFISTIDA